MIAARASEPSPPPRTGDARVEARVRRCVVTGKLLPPAAMIRFVVAPDGTAVPDVDGRLPGRGLWVAAEREVLLQAAGGPHFSKAARRKVLVPDALAERVEAVLATRCRDLLGLARRAGAAVAGFEKVRTALRSRKARLLIAAADGASDGRGKIRVVAPQLPVVEALTAAELGQVFGRDAVVHVAVTDAAQGLADRVQEAFVRLAGLRGRGS